MRTQNRPVANPSYIRPVRRIPPEHGPLLAKTPWEGFPGGTIGDTPDAHAAAFHGGGAGLHPWMQYPVTPHRRYNVVIECVFGPSHRFAVVTCLRSCGEFQRHSAPSLSTHWYIVVVFDRKLWDMEDASVRLVHGFSLLQPPVHAASRHVFI